MRMLADVTKIHRETGWATRIGLETTLRNTLDEWKKRLA
jgi:nucleoside-diphosphate-sugar epimerase